MSEILVYKDDYYTRLTPDGLTDIVCKHCDASAAADENIDHGERCPEYETKQTIVHQM